MVWGARDDALPALLRSSPSAVPLRVATGSTATRSAARARESPARLLLARDVRPTDHERAELVHLVAKRARGDLLDAGIALATASGHDGPLAAHGWCHARLSTGLVSRRTFRQLLGVRRQDARAPA